MNPIAVILSLPFLHVIITQEFFFLRLLDHCCLLAFLCELQDIRHLIPLPDFIPRPLSSLLPLLSATLL